MTAHTIDEAIREHEERCAESLPKRFVPWTWVVGICVLLLGSIGGMTWALSSAQSDTSHNASYAVKEVDATRAKIAEHDARLTKLETLAEGQQIIIQEIRALRTDLKSGNTR